MDGLPDWLRQLIPTGPKAAGNPVVTAASVTASLDRPDVTEFELKGHYLHIGTPAPGTAMSSGDLLVDSVNGTTRVADKLGNMVVVAGIENLTDAAAIADHVHSGDVGMVPLHETVGMGLRTPSWSANGGQFMVDNRGPRQRTRNDALNFVLGSFLPPLAWNIPEVERLSVLVARAMPCVPWIPPASRVMFMSAGRVGAELRHAPRRSFKLAVDKGGQAWAWVVGNNVPLVDGWRDETNPMKVNPDDPNDILGVMSELVESAFFDAEQGDDAEALFVPRRLAIDYGAQAGDVVWQNPLRTSFYIPDDVWVPETAPPDAAFTDWPDPGAGSFRPPTKDKT